jgi:hypothetical protein
LLNGFGRNTSFFTRHLTTTIWNTEMRTPLFSEYYPGGQSKDRPPRTCKWR